MDMASIIIVQFATLIYGGWTVLQARPIYMVFEIDRFRTVHTIDVPSYLPKSTHAQFQSLPLRGPKLIAVRPFKNEQERIDATFFALQGLNLGAHPDLWVPFEAEVSKLIKEAKPINDLMLKKQALAPLIQSSILDLGVSASDVRYLPVAGREAFWTVLVHTTSGRPLKYLPIDPY